MRIGSFMFHTFTLIADGQPVFWNQTGSRIGGIVNVLLPVSIP